jgi:hypothetical protein
MTPRLNHVAGSSRPGRWSRRFALAGVVRRSTYHAHSARSIRSELRELVAGCKCGPGPGRHQYETERSQADPPGSTERRPGLAKMPSVSSGSPFAPIWVKGRGRRRTPNAWPDASKPFEVQHENDQISVFRQRRFGSLAGIRSHWPIFRTGVRPEKGRHVQWESVPPGQQSGTP